MKRHVQNYTGTREALSRLFACKKTAALALAVSLWIAGGSVASAAELYLQPASPPTNPQTYIVTPDSGYPVGASVTAGNGKTMTIDGGTWDTDWTKIYAGKGNLVNGITGSGYLMKDNCTLNVKNATFEKSGVELYGTNNQVTNSSGSGFSFESENNAVEITDSIFKGDAKIYGGVSQDHCKINRKNTVTIAGTTDASGKPKMQFLGTTGIYASGEYPSTEVYYSTVNLYGAMAMENATIAAFGNVVVKNGKTAYAFAEGNGHALHLGGTKSGSTVNGVDFSPWQGYHIENGAVTATVNNTVNEVADFEDIILHQVKWDAATPALRATKGFKYKNHTNLKTNSGGSRLTLNIKDMALQGAPASGTMTLLSSGVDNNFSYLNLVYDDATAAHPATLSGSTPSFIVKSGTAESSAAGGVTLGYQTGAHSVSLADTYTKVNYTIHDDKLVDSVTLGSIAWNSTTPARIIAAADKYNFSTANTITTTDFAFTNPEDVTGSMTLLSGATGLAAGADIAHTQNFTQMVNGATLSATLSGNVTRTANTLGYTATGTALTGVDLTNWNGTTAAVPTGWTSGLTANSITATGFTAPTATTDILTTNTAGFFTDDYITGALKYTSSLFTNKANGVTLSGGSAHGVKASDDGSKLTYYAVGDAGATSVTGISFGEMTWGTGRDASTLGYDFAHVATVSAANLKFTNPEAATGSMTLLSGATNLAAGTNIAHTQNFTKTASSTTLSATLAGNVTRTTAGQIGYTATGTTLNSVNLAGWDGTASAIPAHWTSALAANSITAAGFTAPTLNAGASTNILTTNTASFFNNDQITGAMKYAEMASSSDTASGVTLTGAESKGVKASDDGKSLVYARSNFNVSEISLGKMTWGTARDASAAGYNYGNANIDLSKFMFENPETISAGSTTLLKANSTLADIAATEKNLSYSYAPVSGVRLDGVISGNYSRDNNYNIVYDATANKASKLTFGDVEWKDTGALLTRPANITFAGADVDTTNINFTNIQSLEANRQMTLVSGFGDSVGTITGAKYKVGSTLEGEGKASLVGNNLIFTAETAAESMTAQEQTHNTVMSAEVGMAALSAGNDYVGTATEGLAMTANIGADGVSSYANMGGGSIRQETGSHIDAHTWNAIIALGHQNKKERGTFEYGAFFEYGRGNYTTHNGDERGDGSTHYTGGGLLAKWRKPDGLYVEGSLRAGSVHDDARNVLRDANGVPYSYETNAPYFGGHIGVGKEITLANGNVVDVYGKYFYNRRNGVSFDAGGHYDLDAVTSQVLRIGARYTVKRSKWSFYAGAAYEHELDGKAGGTADGVEIRGADTSGGSFRGEIGAIMKPGDNSPITLDFNLSGFAGKKQGFSGGVSVAFMF